MDHVILRRSAFDVADAAATGMLAVESTPVALTAAASIESDWHCHGRAKVTKLVDEKTQSGQVRINAAVASSPQLATLAVSQAPETSPPDENASGIDARAAHEGIAAALELGADERARGGRAGKKRMRTPVQAAPAIVDAPILRVAGVNKSLWRVAGSSTASAETDDTLSSLRRMMETRARQKIVTMPATLHRPPRVVRRLIAASPFRLGVRIEKRSTASKNCVENERTEGIRS